MTYGNEKWVLAHYNSLELTFLKEKSSGLFLVPFTITKSPISFVTINIATGIKVPRFRFAGYIKKMYENENLKEKI